MDHTKYIFEKPTLMERIARWQMLLSGYDIQCVTQKDIRGSALADCLASQLLEDYQSTQPEFSNEEILALFATRAILISPKKQYIPMTARLCFNCTNNIAEYEACAMGIRVAIEFKAKHLMVYGDFAFFIHKIKGKWETRGQKLLLYQAYIKGLIEYFDTIIFHHISREDNKLVGDLAI